MSTFTGHKDVIRSITITPDSKWVISSSGGTLGISTTKGSLVGPFDNTIRVWNLKTGEELFNLTGHSDSVNVVAITPDRKSIISGSTDRNLKVWNLETRKEIFTLIGHSDSIVAVAITPDGKRVISGSRDSTLKIWNLETGEEVFPLIGHTESIVAIAITPDGKRVISTSHDRTIKVWELFRGREIASFTVDHPLSCCAVIRDGVTFVAGDDSGQVHFLQLNGIDEFQD